MHELVERNFELAEKIFGSKVYSESCFDILDYTSYKALVRSIEFIIAPRSLNNNLRSELQYTFFKKDYNIQREKAERAKASRHRKKFQAEFFKQEAEAEKIEEAKSEEVKSEEVKSEEYYFSLNFHELNKFIKRNGGSDFMKLSADLRFKLFGRRQYLYSITYNKPETR